MAINGVDDLIGLLGPERVLNFIRGNSYDPIKRAKEDARSRGGPKWVPGTVGPGDKEADERSPKFDDKGKLIAPAPTIGDILLHRYFFAKNSGGILYHYERGVYRPTGEDLVRDAAKGLHREWNVDQCWKKSVAQEIHEWLIVNAPPLWDRPPFDQSQVFLPSADNYYSVF